MAALGRRLLMALGLAGTVAACAASAGAPTYRISQAQLQQAVEQRFPLRRPVAGLVDLELRQPQLGLLPERNRLALQLGLGATGPALRQAYAGSFRLEFGLRYQASDRTVRAHDLALGEVQLPGLTAQGRQLLEAALPALARDALGDVAVHQLRPQDLALSDAMGLQPSAITVTPQGLEVGFSAAPPQR